MVPGIERLEQIELVPHIGSRLPLRRREVQNRLRPLAQPRSLILGRHEPRAPVAIAAGRILGIVCQHNKRRQVVCLGTQAIHTPRPQRGLAAQNAAGVHLAHAAHVIEAVGITAPYHGQLVCVTGEVWIPIAHPQAGLAMLAKGPLGGQERRVRRTAHGGYRARHAGRQRLAI